MSGCLFASFVPIIVITDDKASVKLFTESTIIAIELAINPTISFAVDRSIFTIIENILVFIILFFLI